MKEEGYISKITITAIGCDRMATTEPTPIARVYGYIDGTLSESYDENDPDEKWTCLIGDFEAQNMQTDTVYRSGRLFLPAGIQEVYESASKRANETGGRVMFAIEIRTQKSSNKAGYSYIAVNLIPSAEPDPLQQIRGRLAESPVKQIKGPARKGK